MEKVAGKKRVDIGAIRLEKKRLTSGNSASLRPERRTRRPRGQAARNLWKTPRAGLVRIRRAI
jgi:hypothetical protein